MPIRFLLSLPGGTTLSAETDGDASEDRILRQVFSDLATDLFTLSTKSMTHSDKELHLSEQQNDNNATANPTFRQICHGLNPIGDMRRAVVATEMAHKHLEMHQISASELVDVFRMLDWPEPHNPTQTLRNASRRRFGWMERVPGREGYYITTAKGRNDVIQPLISETATYHK